MFFLAPRGSEKAAPDIVENPAELLGLSDAKFGKWTQHQVSGSRIPLNKLWGLQGPHGASDGLKGSTSSMDPTCTVSADPMVPWALWALGPKHLLGSLIPQVVFIGSHVLVGVLDPFGGLVSSSLGL